MTPEEIEARYGKEALERLFDDMLQNPKHELVSWVLELTSDEEIDEWIADLQSDEEDES